MARMMKTLPLGPILVLIGVFGGGSLWLVLIGLRFDYLIAEVYHGADPGEAIWSLDPLFTILAAIPGIVLVFVGLIMTLKSVLERSEAITPQRNYQQLNLFYLGEICLLVTIVVSLIAFLGISSLIVKVVQGSAILMGVVMITCTIHVLSFVLRESTNRLDSLRLPRYTAILLAVELVLLLSMVLVLRLYTWSLIRTTTLVVVSSGFLGLLLLIPRFLTSENQNGAEGEI